jgi:hypothetical protein
MRLSSRFMLCALAGSAAAASWPAPAAPRVCRLRGGCGGEWADVERPEVETAAIRRELQEAGELLDAAAARQARTAELVRDMAADMLETRDLVQRRIALLAEAGEEQGRRELQELASELAEQMQLVASSGVLDPESQEALMCGAPLSGPRGGAAARVGSLDRQSRPTARLQDVPALKGRELGLGE